MKDFIKFCFAIVCGALLLYTAYLVYIKFFAGDESEEEDLYDEDNVVSLSDRVKKAAQKQLEKIG